MFQDICFPKKKFQIWTNQPIQVKVLSMTLRPNFAVHIYNPKVLIWHFLMKFILTIIYCSSASPGRGDVGSMMWWYWYCIVRNMHDHCCWWWWYGVVVVLQLVVVVVGSKPYLSTTLHPMCLVLVVGVVVQCWWWWWWGLNWGQHAMLLPLMDGWSVIATSIHCFLLPLADHRPQCWSSSFQSWFSLQCWSSYFQNWFFRQCWSSSFPSWLSFYQFWSMPLYKL